MADDIMKYESTLPEGFTGVFYFTNPDEEEFVGVWNKKEYHFPPLSTSPMLIPEHSPIEIQHIRKKFAKDLAEKMFTNTEKYARLMGQERNADGSVRLNSIHQAGTYTLDDLAPIIQKCLQPLEKKSASVKAVKETPIEATLTRNEDGELNTRALKGNESLKAKALSGGGLND